MGTQVDHIHSLSTERVIDEEYGRDSLYPEKSEQIAPLIKDWA